MSCLHAIEAMLTQHPYSIIQQIGDLIDGLFSKHENIDLLNSKRGSAHGKVQRPWF